MIQFQNTGLLFRAIGLGLFVLLLPAIAFAATQGAVGLTDLTTYWA